MKRSVRMVVAAGGLLGIAGAGSTAGAQATAPNPIEYLSAGKAVLEQACGVCHGLEKSLSMTFDKAGWEKVVERMHDHGAEVSKAERAQVVAYLLTKNTFEAKCSFCHPTARPLGKSKAAADWLATAQRMSEKKTGHLTEAEIAGVAAYLSIVRPLP